MPSKTLLHFHQKKKKLIELIKSFAKKKKNLNRIFTQKNETPNRLTRFHNPRTNIQNKNFTKLGYAKSFQQKSNYMIRHSKTLNQILNFIPTIRSRKSATESIIKKSDLIEVPIRNTNAPPWRRLKNQRERSTRKRWRSYQYLNQHTIFCFRSFLLSSLFALSSQLLFTQWRDQGNNPNRRDSTTYISVFFFFYFRSYVLTILF